MDSVQYSYIRNNKYFLYCIGQWPYQSLLEKILVGIFVIPCVSAQTILQTGGMVTAAAANDTNMFLESFSPVIISFMCLSKFINFFYNQEQMKKLIDIMQEDWNVHKKYEKEKDILCRHYATAKKITFNYAVSVYGSMTPFMVTPTILNIADAFGVYNMSNERPLMFLVEHFVNVEKYYYALLIHSYLGTLTFITVVVAVDTMIVLYVQHECGLCEILGQRLQNIMEGDSMDIELHPDKNQDTAYQNFKKCIILHKHIIEFAKAVEDANTTSYFFQLGFNMIGISFTQYQAVVNLSNPSTSLRFASFTLCLLSILLLISWPGQQLFDYTERISEYTTSGKWYQSSINTRRLLNIMLSKSVMPLKLTALRLYTLNIENFSTVLRTSFSYCMMLCSIQ